METLQHKMYFAVNKPVQNGTYKADCQRRKHLST